MLFSTCLLHLLLNLFGFVIYIYSAVCLCVVIDGMRVDVILLAVWLCCCVPVELMCVLLGLRFIYDVWSPRAISNPTPLPRGVR